MKFIYRFRKNIMLIDNDKYIVYGIETWMLKQDKYYLVEYIPDVFFEYERAEKFVNLCNSLKISPIHLLDLIEDEFS